MNAPSIDVKDMLVAAGLGLVFGANLFIGQEPSSPDNCVTIFDTPGYPPQLTFDPDERYDYPSIQVRVRNRSYTAAYDLISDIKTELHGLSHDEWNGTTYELIKCAQEPFPLGHDESNRSWWVANFDVQRH